MARVPHPFMITQLGPNQIFVFGSNLAGRHGKGAAKTALKWGARFGHGEGLQGRTYAIPTKDRGLRVRSLDEISRSVKRFLNFSDTKPELIFLVTAIGCGLAGYSPNEIAPMFMGCHPNVVLPEEFIDP